MAAESDARPPLPPVHKWGHQGGATDGYVATGRILGPWRHSAGIVVEPLTDFPDRFNAGQAVWIRGVPHTIEASERSGSRYVLLLAGLDDPDAAVKLKDLYLEIPESEQRELEPDRYYEHQILGLRVRTEDGAAIGTVAEILHTGSNDVYIVRGGEAEVLIPAIEDVIKAIDLERGEMVIELIDGLLPAKRARP
jgi:16S rRNA processing protein RimM